jgi:hypothetical protein
MNASKVEELDIATCHAAGNARQAADRSLDSKLLRQQNRVYARTGGVSANNCKEGFVPGFLDTRSGVAVPSRFANGLPAPVHVLEGLPEGWIAERNTEGLATKACQGVIAGFLRFGRFYSRDEAARAVAA